MHAVWKVYPDSAAAVHLSGGTYSNETEVGPVYIDSPLTIKGGYDPDNWNTRNIDSFPSSIFSSGDDEIATIVFSSAESAVLDGLTIKQTQSLTNGSFSNVYLSEDSSVSIIDCDIINYCSDEGYRGAAIVAKGSLAFNNSVLDMSVKTDETSYAFSAYKDITVTNSTVSISDTMYDTEHSTWGILSRSDTIIENSVLTLNGTGNAELRGIIIDTDGATLSGYVSGNTITIGDTFSKPQYIYAIQCEQLSDFVITRNQIDIPVGSSLSEGIYLSYCDGICINNNVIHGGEGAKVSCIALVASKETEITNNTLFMGSSYKYTSSTAQGIYLQSSSSVSKCIGNIIYGDNRYSRTDFLRSGIYCQSTGDIISQLDHNAFANLNYGLIRIYYSNSIPY